MIAFVMLKGGHILAKTWLLPQKEHILCCWNLFFVSIQGDWVWRVWQVTVYISIYNNPPFLLGKRPSPAPWLPPPVFPRHFFWFTDQGWWDASTYPSGWALAKSFVLSYWMVVSITWYFLPDHWRSNPLFDYKYIYICIHTHYNYIQYFSSGLVQPPTRILFLMDRSFSWNSWDEYNL